MRETNNKTKKINTSMRNITTRALWNSLAISLFLMFTMTSTDLGAQCERRAMACNNLVNVTLDENCMAIITIDMILEDQQGADNDYTLRIFDPEGNRIMTDTLREDYDCKHLKVEVECKRSGIYCWGYIIVEDKIKPNLTVTPLDTAVFCNVYDFELDPTSLVTQVTFSDQGSCEKPDSLGITDLIRIPRATCSDTLEIIERYWKVVDKSKYKNDSTVVQRIYLLRARFNQFEYPKDTIIDCLDAGDLSVAKLGEPILKSCDPYFDIIFDEWDIPTCGGSKKISRSWKIFDTCRNRDTTVFQTIEVTDKHAPTIDFSSFDLSPDRFVTSKEECTATARDIPNPIFEDCSKIQASQIRAFYQFVDAMGVPYGFRYNAIVNNLQTFDLVDVPVGQEFIVIWEATDSCGNIAVESDGPWIAEDRSFPNAICEKSTIVAINSSGMTEVKAESLDDYSFDNCGIVRKQIRRIDSNCPGFSSDRVLGNSVHFCCEDVANNPIKVLLRVYDAHGNFSDCIIDVVVQDKRIPTLRCPQDLLLDCSTDLTRLEARLRQNLPVVSWVCGVGTINVEIPDFTLTSCGFASFFVTWTATDANGASAKCIQKVTIDNLTQPVITAPPAEITVTNCTSGLKPENIPNSAPRVTNVDCEQLAITYEDLPFSYDDPNLADACLKIRRTWTIMDWCKFETGNANSAVIRKFEQILKIVDNQAPVFQGVQDDFEVNDSNRDCQETVNITLTATDNCTDASELKYRYTLRTAAGTLVSSGNTNKINGTYGVGAYTFKVYATDKCNNIDSASVSFEIVTTKAPVPILVGSYPVNIQANGSVTLLARDLNVKSTQGCSSSEAGLVFAFSSNPSNTTRTFTCQDLTNGVFGNKTVNVFVIDQNGNFSSAAVEIFISDQNFNACPDNITTAAVDGRVTDENFKGVANISVSAFNPTKNTYEKATTDVNGRYNLTGLETYQDYMVTPSLTGHDLSGVSTLDLVLIQRHILGIAPLSSPYKIIAADVNNSKSISGSDLAELRKLILGNQGGLSQSESWKFIRRDHKFSDNLSPWDYPVMAEVYDLTSSMEGLDFIALKLGDVNGNAFAALAQELAGPRSALTMTYTFEQNDNLITYTLTPEFTQQLFGLQMALSVNATESELVEVKGLAMPLTEDMIALSGNSLRISWSSAQPVSFDQSPAIQLVFRSKGKGSASELSLDASIDPEAYNANLETSRLVLRQAAPTLEAEFRLIQNSPNPFNGVTTIAYQTGEAGKVQLDVFDVNGRIVYKDSQWSSGGLNSFSLDSRDLRGSGIYYYTISTATHSDTKRMMVLN